MSTKKSSVRKRRNSTMTTKNIEIIEVEDYFSSPEQKYTPMRPVFCLKNRNEIKKFEESEDCFILDFDPNDELNMSKISFSKDSSDNADADADADADVCVVAEKGKVACRDYPHPRNSCAKFPFEKTTHESHCKLCYCYVCDLAAPCKKWTGAYRHCDAFKNAAWDNHRAMERLSSKVPNRV